MSVTLRTPCAVLAFTVATIADCTPSGPPQLIVLTVTPENARIALGGQTQFAASGLYTDHTIKDLTGQVAWSLDDAFIGETSRRAREWPRAVSPECCAPSARRERVRFDPRTVLSQSTRRA